jgi:hypothetical protein
VQRKVEVTIAWPMGSGVGAYHLRCCVMLSMSRNVWELRLNVVVDIACRICGLRNCLWKCQELRFCDWPRTTPSWHSWASLSLAGAGQDTLIVQVQRTTELNHKSILAVPDHEGRYLDGFRISTRVISERQPHFRQSTTAAMATGTGWAQLRQQIRTLESQVHCQPGLGHCCWG